MKKTRPLAVLLATVMILSTLTMSMTAQAALPFNDTDGHWGEAAIEYVVDAGLMNGVGNGASFAPNMSLTRGMVVTVLYRNERANQYECYDFYNGGFDGFVDVAEGAYYYDAVMWAGQNEIVNGTGTDDWGEPYFSPDRAITRQELATMFLRYAKYKYVTNNDKADLSKYPDSASVASWATDAVAWSVYVGLITGKSNGGVTTLSPTDTATRAEFATIIKRYNEADFDYESVFNMPIPLSSFTEPEFEIRDDADIFVAVDGSDSNPGTLDKPLATFGAAVNKVRELKKTAKEEIVVAFKAGNYGAFTQDFTEADSGSEKVPVTYCAYGDGEVVFDAGVQVNLDEFVPITDAEKYLFPNKAVSKIMKADLSNKNYSGELTMFSYLYSDEDMQIQARFPNTKNDGSISYVTPAVVHAPSPDTNPTAQFKEHVAERFDNYHTYENILITGIFGDPYHGNYKHLVDYNPETNEFTMNRGAFSGLHDGAKMVFHNISEELDFPNEYWVDLDTKTLYVYEPYTNYTLATAGCFVNIGESANYLSFVGLSFKHINNDYAFFIKGDNITIDACYFFGIGDEFTIYSYGQNFHLTRNEFAEMCGGGVIVRNSGDRDKLISGGLVIDNNSFHDYENMHLTYKPAILIQEAVGAQITHNEIYNGIHAGIIYGNGEFQRRFSYQDYLVEMGKIPEDGYIDNELYYIDNVIEYNFIHDLYYSEVGDAGAIYIPRSAADRGNEINHNLIANVMTSLAWGIYLDDGMSGVTVNGNIFFNTGRCAIMGGGSNYNITNNVVIFTAAPIFRAENVFQIGPKYMEMLFSGIDELNNSPTWPAFIRSYNKIPTDPEALALWRERWPELFLVADNLTVTEDRLNDPYCPTNNFGCVITDNHTFSSTETTIGTGKPITLISTTPDTETGKLYYEWNTLENNPIMDLSVANEYFANASDGNYTIKDGCGIEDNHFDKIGRY